MVSSLFRSVKQLKKALINHCPRWGEGGGIKGIREAAKKSSYLNGSASNIHDND